MVKKKEIIQYLESQGFVKYDGNIDCYNNPNRCYYVEVNARSKANWIWYFINPKNDCQLRLHNYFFTFVDKDGNICSFKLNQINEKLIEIYLEKFISK